MLRPGRLWALWTNVCYLLVLLARGNVTVVKVPKWVLVFTGELARHQVRPLHVSVLQGIGRHSCRLTPRQSVRPLTTVHTVGSVEARRLIVVLENTVSDTPSDNLQGLPEDNDETCVRYQIRY